MEDKHGFSDVFVVSEVTAVPHFTKVSMQKWSKDLDDPNDLRNLQMLSETKP